MCISSASAGKTVCGHEWGRCKFFKEIKEMYNGNYIKTIKCVAQAKA